MVINCANMCIMTEFINKAWYFLLSIAHDNILGGSVCVADRDLNVGNVVDKKLCNKLPIIT